MTLMNWKIEMNVPHPSLYDVNPCGTITLKDGHCQLILNPTKLGQSIQGVDSFRSFLFPTFTFFCYFFIYFLRSTDDDQSINCGVDGN